jgi:hypothetical protein
MLSAWIPGATLWLRDMVTGSRRLGRWEGGPQSGPELEVPPQWQPAAS